MGRLYAFRKQGSDRPPASVRGRKSGQFRVTDRRASSDRSDERCDTSGYRPKMESGKTDNCPNLSPSLRGCYADPIELALEEHGEKLPRVIDDPGHFTTRHHYHNPRDPEAFPKDCIATTICRNRRVRTFIYRPTEGLSVFGL
jgi:hypothetical protein